MTAVTNDLPGPNPRWGNLYDLRDQPLAFVLAARQRERHELDTMLFTKEWLADSVWQVKSRLPDRSVGKGHLSFAIRTEVVTPAKGRAPHGRYVYSVAGLVDWIDYLATHVKHSTGATPARTLFQMAKRYWSKHQRSAGFEAVVYYYKAHHCLYLLTQLYQDSGYCAKAQALLTS